MKISRKGADCSCSDYTILLVNTILSNRDISKYVNRTGWQMWRHSSALYLLPHDCGIPHLGNLTNILAYDLQKKVIIFDNAYYILQCEYFRIIYGPHSCFELFSKLTCLWFLKSSQNKYWPKFLCTPTFWVDAFTSCLSEKELCLKTAEPGW